jgi:hypothetical protein
VLVLAEKQEEMLEEKRTYASTKYRSDSMPVYHKSGFSGKGFLSPATDS